MGKLGKEGGIRGAVTGNCKIIEGYKNKKPGYIYTGNSFYWSTENQNKNKTKRNCTLQLLQDSSKNISGAIFSESKAKAFLEEIRVVPALEEFPVLVSLKDSNHELESELIELDVIDFLKTPYSERRTLNRLKNLVKLSNANHLIYELERDELTGLYTRQAFLRKAEEIRSQNMHKHFCIMAFDFDNFKSSNTLYGEEKCNEFLAYTGKRLKGVLPKGIAGRFGGDQYVLFYAYEGETIDLKRLNDVTSSILASAPIPHQVVKTGVNAPIDNNQPMVGVLPWSSYTTLLPAF